MLRPATPLTALLFAALILLTISIISTPIIRAIPLGQYNGVDFGVFGYCQGSTCSKVEISYSTASLFSDSDNGSFDLPTKTRSTLSNLLIIHPVAAFFTLIMLILAGTAHAHSPSHSPRYLLGLFILSILTLLLALLCFLVDVLLFAPHMAWGSYIVLAATVVIAASGIVSCAMRRTLVSRKARAKRIAENAEMNGENFYARQATEPVAPLTLPPPIVNGGPGGDKLPSFATFDMENKETERTSDERIPLTARTPSERSPGGAAASLNGGPGTDERYAGQLRTAGAPGMGNGRPNGPPQRDEFGNPINPQGPYGAPGLRRDGSQDRMRNEYPDGNFRGRGGPMGGYRGRGGPGYGRGGFNPIMRGGYGPGGPGRGGPNGMMGMRGGRGPPPGYPNGNNGPIYPGQSPGGPYGQSDRRRPPGPPGGPGYGGEPAGGFGGYGGENRRDSLPRAESPPPLPGMDDGQVGQAIEMDATTGSPSHAPQGFRNHFGPLRDSDGDVAGMVGLQQQRANIGRHDTVQSDSSRYSNEASYVPPRQAWVEQGRASPLKSSRTPGGRRRRSSGDNYYEDVDPRFAEPVQPQPELQTLPSSSVLPASLTPGYSSTSNRASQAYLHPSSSNPALVLEGNNSYEDIQEGSRSPAESERSNFTSVSQRGVNPRWNPGMGPGGYGPPMPMPINRRPVAPPQRNEILLNSNPDFELPGRAGRGPPKGGPRGPPPGGMVPRSAYDGGAAM